MSMWSPESAIGAIRLALEAAADDAAALTVVETILSEVDPTPGNDTGPVECLVWAIRQNNGVHLSVGTTPQRESGKA